MCAQCCNSSHCNNNPPTFQEYLAGMNSTYIGLSWHLNKPFCDLVQERTQQHCSLLKFPVKNQKTAFCVVSVGNRNPRQKRATRKIRQTPAFRQGTRYTSRHSELILQTRSQHLFSKSCPVLKQKKDSTDCNCSNFQVSHAWIYFPFSHPCVGRAELLKWTSQLVWWDQSSRWS